MAATSIGNRRWFWSGVGPTRRSDLLEVVVDGLAPPGPHDRAAAEREHAIVRRELPVEQLLALLERPRPVADEQRARGRVGREHGGQSALPEASGLRQARQVDLERCGRVELGHRVALVESPADDGGREAVPLGQPDRRLHQAGPLVEPCEVPERRALRDEQVGDDGDRVGPFRERQRTIGDHDALLEPVGQQAGSGELAEERDEPGSSPRSANSSAAGSRTASAGSVR